MEKNHNIRTKSALRLFFFITFGILNNLYIKKNSIHYTHVNAHTLHTHKKATSN